MRVWLWLRAALLVTAWPALVHGLPLEELVESTKSSVLHLSIRNTSGDEVSSGSGFVVSDDGKLATNYHVLERATRVVAVFGGGKEVGVSGAWALDPDSDLAVLQLEKGSYQALDLAARAPKPGTSIVVIGSPRGLQGTVSTGIVSAVRDGGVLASEREQLSSWGLQITAPISPGSSGSPVLDTSGAVVGVAVGQRLHGEALNFAVPAARLQALLERAEREVAPKPLPQVATEGRSLQTNLAISAAVVFALLLSWWLVARRAEQKAPKRSLARFGIRE